MKYCAARGAYKGAGAESLSQLIRGQYGHEAPLPGESGMGSVSQSTTPFHKSIVVTTCITVRLAVMCCQSQRLALCSTG